MTDKDTHDSTDEPDAATLDSGESAGRPAPDGGTGPDNRPDGRPEPDGGTEADGGTVTAGTQSRQDTDYLTSEVNLLRPSTPFMRDHLRVIWTGFAVWAVVVFGPVTLTAIAPGAMTTTLPVVGFPLHYFLVAIGAPGGALLLAFWYARKRDELDEKYGISHGDAGGGASE